MIDNENNNNNFISRFSNEKYINIQTVKKNGKFVNTPVWFIIDKNNNIIIRTNKESGKIKRIRNNNNVKIIPCNVFGKISKGLSWTNAIATIEKKVNLKEIDDAFCEKYGFKNNLVKIIYKIKRLDISIISISFISSK